MPTCPDCGSIVMEGDPYCSHCGAHLLWNLDDESDYEEEKTDVEYHDLQYFHDDEYVFERDYDKPKSFLDYGETSQTYYSLNENKLDEIVGLICINKSQERLLKSRIKKFMKAPDFNGFYIRKDFGFEVFYFHFIQENEFVKTTHVMTFIQDEDYFSPYKAFYESYSRHDHDKLTSNPEFQRMIESTGLEFSGCGGGYTLYLEQTYLEVEMTDDIDIHVFFNLGNKHRMYDLDLDNMCLSSQYNEYDN